MLFSDNLANLPCRVEGIATDNAGLTLNYGYLSDGTKTSSVTGQGEGLKYRGSFVYEVTSGGEERLNSIAWDEGRIAIDYSQSATNPYVRDEWHVRDHLGNTRMIVDLTAYGTIIENNEYLPFGTRLAGSPQSASNRYSFAGKEEQRFGTGTSSLDLHLSDFGARYYDPYTARWTTRDPLTGKYPAWSPYNYCAGNPVNLVDPDGNIIDTFLDAASLAMGIKSFASNVKQGKVGAAIVDGLGIVADAASLATPFVSAGAGMAIKAVRGADKAADALKIANKADDVADASKGLKNADAIWEGKKFEKTTLAEVKASGKDATGQVKIVPNNGKGNTIGNTTNADIVVRNENGHYDVIETKRQEGTSRLSKGQKTAKKHVIDGNGSFTVRSSKDGFYPNQQIVVDNYEVKYLYPRSK